MVRLSAGTPGLGTAGVLLASACLPGCAGHHHPDTVVGAPVTAVAPTRAPWTVTGPPCTVRGSVPGAEPTVHGLVSVDPSPTAVVLVWLPGSNGHPCRAVLGRAGQRVARAIAAAVDTAPAVPDGMSAGPADDLMKVRLYLTYPAGVSEEVTVGLGGGEHLRAPGRDARELTDALAAVLRPLAPPAWRLRLNVDERPSVMISPCRRVSCGTC